MMRFTTRFFLILILILSPFFSHAGTGTSLNVPIGDPTYAYIDKLVASGLIKTPIYGQRPWTVDYVTSLVREALENRDRLIEPLEHSSSFTPEQYNRRLGHKRFIDDILTELTDGLNVKPLNVEQSSSDIQLRPLRSISLTHTFLDNGPSAVPANGLGGVDAVIHPLVANRKGKQYNKGHHFYWETEHSAQITPYFAAYAKPQFQFSFPNGGNDQAHAYLGNLYAKTGWRNIELEAGRDQLLWGQGLHGGLMFSDNPRGLDMIKVSTPYPFRLPWFLRHLGKFKATALAATTGPEQTPKNPILLGYRLDWMPLEWLDAGFEHITVMGGDGISLPSAPSILGEFIGVPTSGADPDRGGQASNRVVSADLRFTIKKLRGLTFYGEGFMEDKNVELGLLFFHDMAWLAGAYLPRLDYTGKWDLRLEYEHIGEFPYRHGQYSSGWTMNKLLLGNIMGPDSNRATAVVDYFFTPVAKFSGNFSFLHRSSNQYAGVAGGDVGINDIMRTVDGVEEYHVMNIYKLEIPLTSSPIPLREGARGRGLFFRTSFGWDYVHNAGFLQGNKKADFMTEIGLTLRCF